MRCSSRRRPGSRTPLWLQDVAAPTCWVSPGSSTRSRSSSRRTARSSTTTSTCRLVELLQNSGQAGGGGDRRYGRPARCGVLLFSFVAVYLCEADAPVAEHGRRMSIDRSCSELLGEGEFWDRRSGRPGRCRLEPARRRDPSGPGPGRDHDLLRDVGPLTTAGWNCVSPTSTWRRLDELARHTASSGRSGGRHCARSRTPPVSVTPRIDLPPALQASSGRPRRGGGRGEPVCPDAWALHRGGGGQVAGTATSGGRDPLTRHRARVG